MWRVAEPLVDDGLAQLVWMEPDEGWERPWVRLVPTSPNAAAIEMRPDWDTIHLYFGEGEWHEEFMVSTDINWVAVLEDLLRSVVGGGLRVVAEHRHSGFSVEMTFEIPDHDDYLVRSLEAGSLPPDPPPRREIRFASYTGPPRL